MKIKIKTKKGQSLFPSTEKHRNTDLTVGEMQKKSKQSARLIAAQIHLGPERRIKHPAENKLNAPETIFMGMIIKEMAEGSKLVLQWLC